MRRCAFLASPEPPGGRTIEVAANRGLVNAIQGMETGMQTVLKVEDLSKSYGSIVVVDDLTFEVVKGECLGIIGPNGAGKTSLFNVIDGGVKPNAGRIILQGEDVTRLPRHKRAHKGIARAYQVPQPFPDLSVFENVLVAATFAGGLAGKEARQQAADVIERAMAGG